MNAYESYITTELPWLFKMPYHWDIMRAKYMFQKESRAVSETDEVITCFRDGVVTLRKNRRTTGFTEAIQESGYQGIRKGDLVIHVMDAFAGAVGVSDSNGKGTPVYSVCTAKGDYNNYYYAHIVREMARSGFIQSLYRGIRQRSSDFRFEIFAAQYLPVPPREEQDQIVRYLDWQVSKINKLIAAKKKQIVFLKECRKAVIDTAILHGMNKHTEEKDSGVYWLGRIPASWEVLSLRRICSINASISHLIKKLPSDELVVFLPMESVSTEGIVDCSQKKPLHEVRTGYSSFARNDVVVAKITPCFENGKGACLDKLDTEIGFGTTEFINIRASEKVLPQYLYYITITQPFRILGAEVMTGSAGQKRISTDFIKNFTLGIPDIKEQQELLNILNDNLLKIDNAIQLVASTIDKLQEYRTRLISDVVTGQIDVRGIEIPEYEYVEEESDEETDETEGADEEVEEQEE